MTHVDLSRVPDFYHTYISKVPDVDLRTAFTMHQKEMIEFLISLPADKWDYRYAPGKWSIREVVQHLIDGERVFGYRALRFARHDATELPGFDENLFAQYADADRRSSADLMQELQTVQRSSAQLFASFTEAQLERSGKANGKEVYVKGIGYVIVGHTLHHLQVTRERYL